MLLDLGGDDAHQASAATAQPAATPPATGAAPAAALDPLTSFSLLRQAAAQAAGAPPYSAPAAHAGNDIACRDMGLKRKIRFFAWGPNKVSTSKACLTFAGCRCTLLLPSLATHALVTTMTGQII